MMITLSIFAVVSMISVNVITNTLKSARRIQTQVFLYTEAQALADRLTRDVESNAVDYEAYFARNVLGETGWETQNYGQYAQAFYNPGVNGPSAPGPYPGIGGYGAYCNSQGDGEYPADCEVPAFSDIDVNTGAHPFTGIGGGYPDQPEDMNAFCREDGVTVLDCTEFQHHITDELILINEQGDERLIYRLVDQAGPSSNTQLAKMSMLGTDTDNDGLVDNWACASIYGCTVPLLSDFQPVSPSALTIESFYITITPTEDPYRAFTESELLVQPQVTFFLTVSLSDSFGVGIIGDPPSISIQRSISTGVYKEIVSYE